MPGTDQIPPKRILSIYFNKRTPTHEFYGLPFRELPLQLFQGYYIVRLFAYRACHNIRSPAVQQPQLLPRTINLKVASHKYPAPKRVSPPPFVFFQKAIYVCQSPNFNSRQTLPARQQPPRQFFWSTISSASALKPSKALTSSHTPIKSTHISLSSRTSSTAPQQSPRGLHPAQAQPRKPRSESSSRREPHLP